MFRRSQGRNCLLGLQGIQKWRRQIQRETLDNLVPHHRGHDQKAAPLEGPVEGVRSAGHWTQRWNDSQPPHGLRPLQLQRNHRGGLGQSRQTVHHREETQRNIRQVANALTRNPALQKLGNLHFKIQRGYPAGDGWTAWNLDDDESLSTY